MTFLKSNPTLAQYAPVELCQINAGENESKPTGSQSGRSNLCQDKINTTSLVHVVGQKNPLADPGVTFRCGCQDVSASVQQPPVVAVIGWSQGDEREKGERGDGSTATCQKGAESAKTKRVWQATAAGRFTIIRG